MTPAPTLLTDSHSIRAPAYGSLRPLSLADYRRFTREFPARRGSAQYGSGWLYLTQACRDAGPPLGAFLEAPSFVAGFGRHNNHWVLVRPVGTLPARFLESLIDLVQATDSLPYVFVKLADLQMRTQLRRAALAYGARVLGAKHYRWDAASPHDDQTFPDVLMPVPTMCQLVDSSGEPARKLRSKVRRFYNAHGGVQFTTVAKLGPARVQAMLSHHFGSDQSYVRSYLNMIDILGAPRPLDTWWHFVPVIDGQPAGLFAYERVDSTSAAVYASIAHHRYTGLGEAMMLEMACRMRHQGFLVANLGGSEQESLYRYKRKFAAGSPPHRRQPICVVDLHAVL